MAEGAKTAEIPNEAEIFLATISEQMEQEIRKRIIEKNPKMSDETVSEDTERLLEREKKFCRRVIDAYSAWSQEPEPVAVLWDIDDTMGRNVIKGDRNIWRLRPSLLPLMTYLQERFPNIRNGILSNRFNIAEQLEDSEALAPIRDFIDTEHLYTSRGTPPSARVNAYFRDRRELPDNEYKEKLTVVWDLQERGVNAKLVDDTLVAKTLGKDGIYVFHLAAPYI